MIRLSCENHWCIVFPTSWCNTIVRWYNIIVHHVHESDHEPLQLENWLSWVDVMAQCRCIAFEPTNSIATSSVEFHMNYTACMLSSIVTWSPKYIYIYIYTDIHIRRPLLVRGHQAARHMKLITVKLFLLSAIVSLLDLVSKYSSYLQLSVY